MKPFPPLSGEFPMLTKFRTKADEKSFVRFMNELVDDVFDIAINVRDWSINEFAGEAFLSHGTVSRLYNRVTKEPRFTTVYKLAGAVGLSMRTIKAEARIRMAKLHGKQRSA